MRTLLVFIFVVFLWATEPSITIIDTGSTNIPGLRVTIDPIGSHAMIERRNGTRQRMKMSKAIRDRFLRDLQTADPLNALPANHCMKSASFGSSLYIESGGVRSPDLSCQAQADPRAAALRNDATEILKVARIQ